MVDVSGRRVRRLAEGWRPAGWQGVEWDGTDDRQRRVAAGVYFLRLETGGGSASRRVVRLPR